MDMIIIVMKRILNTRLLFTHVHRASVSSVSCVYL